MGKLLLKAHSYERAYNYVRGSPIQPTKESIIGSREKHFDVKHHVCLHVLIENLPMRVCQDASPSQCHM